MSNNEHDKPTFTVDQIAEYLKQTDGWNLTHPDFGIEQYFKDRKCEDLFLRIHRINDNPDIYSCDIVNRNMQTLATLSKGTIKQAIEGSIFRICTLLEHLDTLRQTHCK